MSRGALSLLTLFGALIAFARPQCAFAEYPSVTAVLSNSEATVGQNVQLEIKVRGANSANVPDISLDGLEIRQTGTSHQIELHNMSSTSTAVYIYTILPLKPGAFKIPPQEVRVGNSSLQTPELTLHVVGSPGRQPAPNRGNSGSNVNAGKLAFAE